MKKIVSLLSVAILFASCNNYSSYVTVVGKADNTSAKITKVAFGTIIYNAVTQSGDTIQVIVPENIAIDNKIPYTGRMVKDETERFGQIRMATTNH